MSGLAKDATRPDAQPADEGETRIRLSLSEIEALGTKAARATGFEWGLAEEAGWATARLAELGLEAPELLLGLLEAPRGAAPRPVAGGWGGAGRPLCPIMAGAAVADHAGLPGGPLSGVLELGPLLCPAFLLPFAARAAARRGSPLLVGTATTTALVRPRSAPALFDPGPWQSGRPETVTIAVATDDGRDPAPRRARQHVPLSVWSRLDRLALGTTVPPSARSRAGAGAAHDDD